MKGGASQGKDMHDVLMVALGLFGGLAIFIYGMNLMSENLQKVAGERMRSVLALLTKNPVMGVLAGALATAVLQSSSATTVMAIGFVSARLMGLPQAISIIFGANIGTTITAQIVAFKITDYIMLFVFLGFLIYFIAKKERTKSLGLSVFGFGLLFLGIDTMGGAMGPLAESPVFTELIAKVASVPVFGVLLGTAMTLIVQSSSATIAVLQNFASQAGPDGVSSVLGLAGALPILLGDNIGTTITAIMASIGQSRNAKRVALSHCLFNVSGALLFIWFIPQWAAFIQFITPGPEVEVISRQIANAHTFFNCCMTLIWLPLIGIMARIVTKAIPDVPRPDRSVAENIDRLARPLFLDQKLAAQPTAALQIVAQEIIRCGAIVRGTIMETVRAARSGDKEAIDAIVERADATHALCEKILDFITDMFAGGVLTEEQAAQTTGMVRILNEFERVSQQCKLMADSLRGDFSDYSEKATTSLIEALEVVEAMYDDALEAVKSNDIDHVKAALQKQDGVLELDMRMRREHMKRVAAGECDPSHRNSFVMMINEIDRISNSCVSIVDTVSSDRVNFGFFVTPEGIEQASETMPRELRQEAEAAERRRLFR